MRELMRHILREELITEMPKKITTQDFINRAKKVHGDKYDYSLVDYTNSLNKVNIICPIHGVFVQTPNDHIHAKSGCPKCGGVEKLNTSQFISNAKEIHGDKYDYSLTNYVNNRTPVTIICPIHGEFQQRPSGHYRYGCNQCGHDLTSEKKSHTQDEFVALANQKYDGKYDYSKVVYTDSKKYVTIGCPIHGDFKQMPYHHLQAKVGCPKCANILSSDKFRKPKEDFINDANIAHNYKYDYSLVDYQNTNSKVTIICPKHGEFTQAPRPHLKGQGCPMCNESRGEKLVNSILIKNNISFNRQKKFKDCHNTKEGKSCRRLPFDFYLPNFNTVIEYDGKQHFEPIDAFGGEKGFSMVKKNDKIKNDYCKTNNIKMIRIPYTMKNDDVESYIKKGLGIK